MSERPRRVRDRELIEKILERGETESGELGFWLFNNP